MRLTFLSRFKSVFKSGADKSVFESGVDKSGADKSVFESGADKSGADKSVRNEDRKAVADFIRAWRSSKPNGERGLSAVATAYPEVYERVTGLKGVDRAYMALALLEAVNRPRESSFVRFEYLLHQDLLNVAGNLISGKGAVTLELFRPIAETWIKHGGYRLSLARIVGVGEDLVAEHGLTPEIEAVLQTVVEKNRYQLFDSQSGEYRKLGQRLQRLLNGDVELPEAWQAPVAGPEMTKIRQHAATARVNTMSDRWARTAVALLEQIGIDAYLKAFSSVIDLVAKTPSVDVVQADMLRGLAWIAGVTESPRAAGLLSRLAILCAKREPGFGLRSRKGFSGATHALVWMGTSEALAQLSNLRYRIKAASLAKQLASAVEWAAERQSLPVEDMEELVVPSYGLELPGVLIENLGTVEARLEVTGATKASLRWFRDGKELKSTSAEVKNAYPEELKELRAAAKEMAETLTSQRARIEGLMLSGRTLPYPAWRERYLEHPLLAAMTRRLVWRFADPVQERLGMPVDGEPLDVEGNLLEGLGPQTTVRLWHPIHSGASAIEAWREFLFVREIHQPFKQAFREIYILTDAEEKTRTYSNRFAAHILKQHQLGALARQQGWQYLRHVYVGSDCDVVLDLPSWNLVAIYSVDVLDPSSMLDTDVMTASGITSYVTTDRLRFQDAATSAPVPLESIPPAVLSEVMRDVDMFVGVCSVGNDPTWGDRGSRGGFLSYWQRAAFGDLSATAETRKQVLQRLLPRLRIGKVSRIEGKYLVVMGNLRTYKIHLGSGNILMEPNNQYLCIVQGFAGAKSNGRVYLPFEEDGALAIILSKAMLLANDDKITDPSIKHQILR